MLKKSTLLSAIASVNRGINATAVQKQAILAAIAQLEAYNPTPCPVEALNQLEGNWRLLYTTSGELLGLDRIPLTTLGEIYQCIRGENSQVYNIAEIQSLPGLGGIVSVAAEFSPVSSQRLNVRFQRAVVGLQSWLGYRSPSQFIEGLKSGDRLWGLDIPIGRTTEQMGWIDITYLDEDLRIGRGNEGSVFVLSKV